MQPGINLVRIHTYFSSEARILLPSAIFDQLLCLQS
jgi:hypothetical protein